VISQKETKQQSGEISKAWKKRAVFFQALENFVPFVDFCSKG
jgi:hypothetical protein